MKSGNLKRKGLIVLSYLIVGMVCFAGETEGVKYIKVITKILENAMAITGGFIGLFGAFQLCMAYLQSNPTAYADAGKKIVAGGMLYGLSSMIEQFFK